MKTSKYSKSEKFCLKVLNKRNKFLEGVFPFSKEGRARAVKFTQNKTDKLKIVKSKI